MTFPVVHLAFSLPLALFLAAVAWVPPVHASLPPPQDTRATTRRAIPKALVDVTSKSASVRLDAVQLLMQAGPNAKPAAVKPLVHALKDRDQKVRWYAAFALIHVDRDVAAAEPLVVRNISEALRSEDAFTVHLAVHHSRRLGAAGRAAIPSLLPLLKDPRFQGSASMALATTGAEDPRVHRALLDALEQVRAQPGVVQALELSDSPKHHAENVERWCALLDQPTPKDEDLSIYSPARSARFWAVQALEKTGATPNAIPALMTALQDRDTTLHYPAMQALVGMGPAALPALGVLLQATRDPEFGVRGTAMDALGAVGSASPEVLAALVDGLHDENEHVRHHAADALARLGPAAWEARHALEALVAADTPWVQEGASKALLSVEGREQDM